MKKLVFIGLVIATLLALLWIGAYADEGRPPARPTRKPQPTWRWEATITPTSVPVPTNTPEPACMVVVPRDVSMDTTWQANCTYIANEGIYVLPGATLRIPKGVVVLIGSWKQFHVYGRLLIDGTAEEPVKIERLHEDLRWIGLSIITSPESLETRLVHLIVSGTWWGLRVTEHSGIVSTTNCAFYGDAPQQF